MVYDKSGKLRPINFSDIAILIRTKKDFNQYVKALIEVEVEGYFVERFINLCMINNIKMQVLFFISRFCS